MKITQNRIKHKLQARKVEKKLPSALEYSLSDSKLEEGTGNNTNQSKSLIDKIIERYKDTWKALAKL
ncbi:MAG: hypothetical protein HQ568_10145 [Calditrichaeota bacterium]|nr:hypothetical protein [Calditrichota bacterium]